MFKTIRRKIAIVILAWLAVVTLVGPMEQAFAAWTAMDPDTGACPTKFVKVAGGPTDKPCLESNNADLKPCPGQTNLYHMKDQDTCPSSSGDAGESLTAQQTIEKALSLIVVLENMLNKLLWPILFLIGDLLKSDILFGSGMEDRLYNIWVPIRNIVNIVFVIALVALALYNVLGISGEQSNYSIKTMLPKLIAGIIAVNFSFIVIKVFLDVVNVFTTAIFAIPTQIEEMADTTLGTSAQESTEGTGGEAAPKTKNTINDAKIQEFCMQVYAIAETEGKDFDQSVYNYAIQQTARKFNIFQTNVKNINAVAQNFEGDIKTNWDDEITRLQDLKLCEEEGGKYMLSPYGNKYFSKYSSNNAALAMAINMGEVLFFKKVSSGMGSGSYESLAVSAIFSLLMYVIYMVSFAVLFVVLLARLVVLWLGIAISPVIALMLTVPIAKDKLKSLEPLIGKFVSHAIAPIPIALSMTVGWIMLNAIKSTMVQEASVLGSPALIPSLPIPGLETLQGLLISLATVAVVWMGVFAAANETIAGTMTKTVQDKLQSFGKFIATAPVKYTPWVPVEIKEGEPERLSLSGIGDALANVEGKMRQKASEKAHRVLGMGEPLKGVENIMPNMATKDLPKIFNDRNLNELEKKETLERLQKLKGTQTYEEIKALAAAGNPFYKELFAAINKNDPESWKKDAKKIKNLAPTEVKNDEKKKEEPKKEEDKKKEEEKKEKEIKKEKAYIEVKKEVEDEGKAVAIAKALMDTAESQDDDKIGKAKGLIKTMKEGEVTDKKKAKALLRAEMERKKKEQPVIDDRLKLIDEYWDRTNPEPPAPPAAEAGTGGGTQPPASTA